MVGESPAAILFDDDGNPILVDTDGSQQLAVRDEEVLGTLKLILAELKKLNFLVACATDIEATTSDTG